MNNNKLKCSHLARLAGWHHIDNSILIYYTPLLLKYAWYASGMLVCQYDEQLKLLHHKKANDAISCCFSSFLKS